MIFVASKEFGRISNLRIFSFLFCYLMATIEPYKKISQRFPHTIIWTILIRKILKTQEQEKKHSIGVACPPESYRLKSSERFEWMEVFLQKRVHVEHWKKLRNSVNNDRTKIS